MGKPLMSTAALIDKMTKKGITFKYSTEDEVTHYLENVNNYFRTACYRKNYEKHKKGKNKGKYIDLDFLKLQELSVIDMHLRHIVSKMSIDIEHALKVSLVKYFSMYNLDGYNTYIKEFLNENEYIKNNISRLRKNSYNSNLVNKFFKFSDVGTLIDYDCPIQAFVEILTFGDFVKFYFFCQREERLRVGDSKLVLCDSELLAKSNIINLVKSLRNGSTHNNCLLENLNVDKSIKTPPKLISIVKEIGGISTSARENKLKVRVILEFVALIIIYEELVSAKIKRYRFNEVKKLIVRMKEKSELMKGNDLVKSSYDFIVKVVEKVVDKNQ